MRPPAFSPFGLRFPPLGVTAWLAPGPAPMRSSIDRPGQAAGAIRFLTIPFHPMSARSPLVQPALPRHAPEVSA